MVLFLKVLGAILALAFGIWMGRGGLYRPNEREIERAMDGGRERRGVRRRAMPFDWLVRRKPLREARRSFRVERR